MIKDLLHHFFIPAESNNYRAKLLHHQSLLILISLLFVLQFFLATIKNTLPGVLGSSVAISSQQLLQFTNQARAQNGLAPLQLNNQLSAAAGAKAANMLSENYWAHNSPEGTTPWVFIKNAGYTYIYAGENLARGFDSSQEVVSAWMASPEHRANLLSGNYKDVGFAVVSGKLTGEDTVLVVEELGSKEGEILAKSPITPRVLSQQTNVHLTSAVVEKPTVSTLSLSKSISLTILSVIMITLLADAIIVDRKKIVRVASHNMDHVLFLGALILCIILAISKGAVI